VRLYIGTEIATRKQITLFAGKIALQPSGMSYECDEED
jgi:hypothetical protein